jgi:hypothetical protein
LLAAFAPAGMPALPGCKAMNPLQVINHQSSIT